VLLSVVLDSDLPLWPPDVDADADIAVFISNADLRLRIRQAAANENQAQPRFLRRLCACVDEIQRGTQPSPTLDSRTVIRKSHYIGDLDVGGSEEGIQDGHRLIN